MQHKGKKNYQEMILDCSPKFVEFQAWNKTLDNSSMKGKRWGLWGEGCTGAKGAPCRRCMVYSPSSLSWAQQVFSFYVNPINMLQVFRSNWKCSENQALWCCISFTVSVINSWGCIFSFCSQKKHLWWGVAIWRAVPWPGAFWVYQLQDIWDHHKAADRKTGSASCRNTEESNRQVR